MARAVWLQRSVASSRGYHRWAVLATNRERTPNQQAMAGPNTRMAARSRAGAPEIEVRPRGSGMGDMAAMEIIAIHRMRLEGD